MLNSIGRTARLGVVLLLVLVTTTSCIFGKDLEVDVFSDGIPFINFSTTTTLSLCIYDEEMQVYSCGFFAGDDSDSFISLFYLTNAELLFTLLILDPIILQVPAGASQFAGSYSTTNASGALVITAGLSSLKADANKSIQAEAGTQLVVIDLPDDAPRTGDMSFNFHFAMPQGSKSFPIKALFSGKAVADGATYYMPLFPCTTNMAEVPAMTISMPNGGAVALPLDNVEGCDRAVYSMAAPNFDNTMLLPLLRRQP
jgi:hypothetical protein